MWQYHKLVNIDKTSCVKSSWGMKLMEFGWINNPSYKYLLDLLATTRAKDRIALIWDYTEDGDIPWTDTQYLYANAAAVPEVPDGYRAKYNSKKWFIINHTLKEYISMDRYIKVCKFLQTPEDKKRIIHPLAPLLACSNWRGGWDYGSYMSGNLVWRWSWHSLEYIMTHPIDVWPINNYNELNPIFIEEHSLNNK